MSKVALIRCDSYDEATVYGAVKRALELLGGAESIIEPDEKILLKPNMLAADPPEKCSATHPAVFSAVARLLSEAGANLTYGDSPAFHSPLSAAKKIGIAAVADSLDIPLADFVGGEDVFYEEALQNKKLFIAKGVLEADGIVSLPKLKTHGFQKMTGSIKNQFGCVPGKLKGEMHVKLPSAIDFSKMLVDLNRYVNPRLYVMDGIMAMQGNGPRGGTPFPMNLIMVSSDPVALDATVCRLIDLEPAYVPTTKIGQEVGMGTYLEENIELVGDDPAQFKHAAFDVDRKPLKPYKTGGLTKVVNSLTVPKPYIVEDKCIQCGVCVLMCPVEGKAVDWANGDKTKAPIYDYSKCIRCYCCQELCPESAIELDVPLIRRMFDRRYRN